MSIVENKNGKYPIMQNPGDPGRGVRPLERKRHVLIINNATLTNPNGFDEKVMLYHDNVFPATDKDEKQVLAETTYR